MPRQKRIEAIGQVYHVISRGIERRKIYRDDRDREEFLRRLSLCLHATGIHCYAWVLMDNHFHLLLRQMENPVSTLMRKLMTGYVQYFNRRYRRVGHLFQNRYKSILCQEDPYFKKLVRYIHLNPVRAKMISTPSKLAEYPWTGHAYILGNFKNEWQNIDGVLSWFGTQKKRAKSQYEGYIINGWGLGHLEEFTGGGLRRSKLNGDAIFNPDGVNQYDNRILGEGMFVSKALKEGKNLFDQKTILKAEGWNLDKLVNHVAKKFNVDVNDLTRGRRYRHLSEPKGVIVFYANERLGIPLSKIAEKLSISGQAAFLLKEKGDIFSKENNNFIT